LAFLLVLHSMGKVLAIDYGLKRTGLAISDDTKTFAFGLTTVPTQTLHQFITDYCAIHPIDGFVVGIPRRLNNLPSQSTPHVEGFIRRLIKLFPEKQVYRVDERFTSSMATQSIIDSGVKKKGRQDKNLVDMVSAIIILQSWIESRDITRDRENEFG
jgi:putative Holliday junction resolvase